MMSSETSSVGFVLPELNSAKCMLRSRSSFSSSSMLLICVETVPTGIALFVCDRPNNEASFDDESLALSTVFLERSRLPPELFPMPREAELFIGAELKTIGVGLEAMTVAGFATIGAIFAGSCEVANIGIFDAWGFAPGGAAWGGEEPPPSSRKSILSSSVLKLKD